jgi:hypothetical protein
MNLRQAQLLGALPQSALLRTLPFLYAAARQTDLTRLPPQGRTAPLKEQLRAPVPLSEQQHHSGCALPKGCGGESCDRII